MSIVRATVTQASPIRVQVDGATVDSPASRLTSYTAVVGHRVRVIVEGTSLLVLGQEATS